MVFFGVHLALIFLAFMPSSLLSLSSQPNTKVPTLSSSPETLIRDTLLSSLSPFQDLSPDIAPLLPSPGGVLPTPTGSDIPFIPSSPSPPNPDDMVAPGPLSAFSPFGLLQASSSGPRSLVCNSGIAVFAGLAAYWSMSI